jgi:hypothetical protein
MSCEDVLRHSVSEVANLGVNVCLTNVCADCETAIYNAVTTAWPGCEVKACLSFYDSWCRKIRYSGNSKQCRKKESEVDSV